MTVNAKFFAYFRDLFGGRERDVVIRQGATVRDALSLLCDTAERRREVFEGGGLKPHLVVMVNGVHVESLRGLDTALAPGDTLAIFPMLGGG
ncbi:MAG: MoaD family protein [Candidatus Aminicenantes bacterium]|nr:MoaD family protein [Candidatus Aminicenantes bacterium]